MQTIYRRNWNRSRLLSDQALPTYTPDQAESLLHSLEQVAGGIVLHINSNKNEYISFRIGASSTLRNKSLKLQAGFTYLDSNISSTKIYVIIRLAKALNTIDLLWTIQNSDLFDKIKRDFFQSMVIFILLYQCSALTAMKRLKKKLDANKVRMLHSCFKQILDATHNKKEALRPTAFHLSNNQSRITITVGMAG